MNYERSTRNNLLLYPDIFPNRLSVDIHYFATIGNGYEWKDGELIEVGEEDKDITIIEAIRKSINFKFDFLSDLNLDSDKMLKISLDHQKNSILYDIDLIFNSQERYKDYSLKRDYVYPISEYSKLVTFPDDIKPDWKEALKNFVNWCLDNKDHLYQGYGDVEDQVKYLIKAKERL